MKKLEKGMTISWIELPWNNRHGQQSFHSVSIIDVSSDKKYVKLKGKISFGGIHTDWFSVKDIIKHNYGGEEILNKFIKKES